MKYSGAGVLSAAFLFLLPFFLPATFFYPAVNGKFFLVALSASVLVLLLARSIYEGRVVLKRSWLTLTLVLVLLVQGVSALLGVFPERSFWSDIFWSSGVFFFCYLAALMLSLGMLLRKKDWSLVFRAIAISGGIFGFLSIIGVNGLGAEGHFLTVPIGAPSLSMGNETYAGAFLFLAFVIGCIEFVRTERGRWRLILLGSLALAALSPLLSNVVGIVLGHTPLLSVFSNPASLLGAARASSASLYVLLAFFLGTFLLQRFLPTHTRIKSIVGFGALILVGLAIGLGMLFTPGSAVQEAYIRESTAARPLVWQTSMDAFVERPLFGWGPENFNFAFQHHFDNRVFLEENIGEIWFERAHNVFIDTLVVSGVFGVGSFALLILAYVLAVYRAYRERRITGREALVLFAVVPAHLLQMQTGFDTIVSYTLLAVIGGYALSLERGGEGKELAMGKSVRTALAGGLVLLVLFDGKLALDEYNRQSALFRTIQVTTTEEQRAAIAASLSRVSSFESLRLSFASFVKGALASIAERPSQAKIDLVLSTLSVYEGYFRDRLERIPDDYRARMNYVYLLLLKTALGEDRLADARTLVQESYDLSPGNPVTYVLGSITELYAGNLAEADRLMEEALAINPDIPFTKDAAEYLERQKRQFPNISVLKFTNL